MKKNVLRLAFITIVSTGLSAQVLQHEVEDGETLYGIARRYEMSLERLAEANSLESPELLLPGTLLTIPTRYTVEKGDTLFSIARRFGSSVEEISRRNELSSSSIRIGQVLRLPPDVSLSPERNDQRIAGNQTSTSEEDSSAREDTAAGAGDNRDGREQSSNETPLRAEQIVVAAEVSEPLSYAEGGVWPVAGSRRMLDGKLPGVMIRAERGTPVYAISSGRVVYAGPHTTFGNVVFIQSAQEYVYVYGGQESVAVNVGDVVDAGTAIGTVGLSPSEGVAALYFSVWQDDSFIDPEAAPRG